MWTYLVFPPVPFVVNLFECPAVSVWEEKENKMNRKKNEKNVYLCEIETTKCDDVRKMYKIEIVSTFQNSKAVQLNVTNTQNPKKDDMLQSHTHTQSHVQTMKRAIYVRE